MGFVRLEKLFELDRKVDLLHLLPAARAGLLVIQSMCLISGLCQPVPSAEAGWSPVVQRLCCIRHDHDQVCIFYILNSFENLSAVLFRYLFIKFQTYPGLLE